MRQFALTVALLGWFFMFKVPHPDLNGITVSVLVGMFKTKKECAKEYKSISDELGVLDGVTLVECQEDEEI